MRGWFLGLFVISSGCAPSVLDGPDRDDEAPDDPSTSTSTSTATATSTSTPTSASTVTSASTATSGGGVWSPVQGVEGCAGHTATALEDGSILVVGDCFPSASAGRIDPQTGTFEAIPTPASRIEHTATRLSNGWVLLAGGLDAVSHAPLGGSWTYRPADAGFTDGDALQQPRFEHAAALLSDGQVLLTGGRHGDPGIGWTGAGVTASAERTSNEGDGLGSVAPMIQDRVGHATVARGGSVFAIGGFSGDEDLTTVERFDGTSWSAGPALPEALGATSALVLADDRIFVVASDGGLLLEANGWNPTAPAPVSLFWDAATAQLEDGAVVVLSWSAYSWECNVSRYDPARDAWDMIPRGPLSCGGAQMTVTPLPGGGFVAITAASAAIYRP